MTVKLSRYRYSNKPEKHFLLGIIWHFQNFLVTHSNFAPEHCCEIITFLGEDISIDIERLILDHEEDIGVLLIVKTDWL